VATRLRRRVRTRTAVYWQLFFSRARSTRSSLVSRHASSDDESRRRNLSGPMYLYIQGNAFHRQPVPAAESPPTTACKRDRPQALRNPGRAFAYGRSQLVAVAKWLNEDRILCCLGLRGLNVLSLASASSRPREHGDGQPDESRRNG